MVGARLCFAASISVVLGTVVLASTLPAAAGVRVLRGVPSTASSAVRLTQLSSDPFHNALAAHKTEVESDNFAFGQTIVATFQVGRYQDSNAGSTDIGWATSTDAGTTWTHGFLPGITSLFPFSAAPYQRVTDPAVTYDAKHHVWMIVSLPRGTAHGQTTYLVPIVSRSPDGVSWQKPVHVAPDNGDFMDKPWITCDNATASRFYGHCYVEYIDVNIGEVLFMSTSRDGGATWSTPAPSADRVAGNGGQPIVQPNGTVLVPFNGFAGIETVNSADGGKTWQSSVFIANANEISLPGGLRDPGPLPSADVDGGGTAYVAWHDCSFRTNCQTNDIVFSTSSDGVHWSAVSRVPTSSLSSSEDVFLPGFGVDHSTAGSQAHVGVTYYDLANYNCTFATCRVYAGYIASTNGGATWNRPLQLAGPMQPAWLPNSDLGYMLGDYLSTSFAGGLAHSSFPVAHAPSNGLLDEDTFTTAKGLAPIRDAVQLSSFGERPRSRRPSLPGIAQPFLFGRL